MKPGKRFGLSTEQKSDVWRRWKLGQTLHEIGRAFGKEHSSIRCLVSRHGGIAPAVRQRALLSAAALLCARKLIETIESDKPNFADHFWVGRAIGKVAFG